MKKRKFLNFVFIIFGFFLGLLFVARFAGPRMLRLYIEAGVGDCQKIPVLCMVPQEQIDFTNIDRQATTDFIRYDFPKMSVEIPKGFTVVQETIKKVYYKSGQHRHPGSVIYCLYKGPDFFIRLFPQLKKQGVGDNYEFIRRVMLANLMNIRGISDAFFVIMKGVFIPDLGDQRNVRMIAFSCADKRGFINYNSGGKENYFDCNIIGGKGEFYKIYIKDKAAAMDLKRVIAIISTVRPLGGELP